MESRRRRAAFALAALFVVLLVVASPLAEGHRVASTRTATSHHDAAAREAAPSPIATSATAPTRRLLALDTLGFVFTPQTVALAALCWLAVAFSSRVLLLCAGLTRRGRAPPFARA